MRRLLNVIAGVAFLVALGIVGATERGGDIGLMWWTLPCFAVMAVAAFVEESEQTKKIICEVGIKRKS